MIEWQGGNFEAVYESRRGGGDRPRKTTTR